MKITRRKFVKTSLYTGVMTVFGSSFLSHVALAEWPNSSI